MVHTNSNSAKREKEAVTFAIHVRMMWYEEKVSNFEIAEAKLKETLGACLYSFLVFVSKARFCLGSLNQESVRCF